MKIQFFASHQHYYDHMLPVYNGLHHKQRGKLIVHERVKSHKGKSYHSSLAMSNALDKSLPVMVAGHSDMIVVNKFCDRVVYMEHGIGLNYTKPNSGLCDSSNREGVVLILSPNEKSYCLSKAANPEVKNYIIGMPLMDNLFTLDKPEYPNRICFSFHFDTAVFHFMRSSVTYYRDEIVNLYRNGYDVVIHAHPRAQKNIFAWFVQNGIPPERMIRDFRRAVEESYLYVCDNSSTIFMFAAVPYRRVVLLNRPSWIESFQRRDKINFRFWQYSGIGKNIFTSKDLRQAIDAELKRDPDMRYKTKREMIDAIFPYAGVSTERAIDVLRKEFT
jgi:hypothetical protein